jgi:hypothetical protein
MAMYVPDMTVLLLIFLVKSFQVSLVPPGGFLPESTKSRLLLGLRHDGLPAMKVMIISGTSVLP